MNLNCGVGFWVCRNNDVTGQDIGDIVKNNLNMMKSMVVFACDNYGANTASTYSTFHELKYAFENKKHIIPVRLSTIWPPKPKEDIGKFGRKQNKFVLSPSKAYLDWSKKDWNAKDCAKNVKDAFQRHHHTSKSENIEGVSV